MTRRDDTIRDERNRAYCMVIGFAHGRGTELLRGSLIELAELIRDDKLPEHADCPTDCACKS